MGTRIEILKDGLWQIITLNTERKIKYNSVINRIGNVATREISHTNTFSIPKIDNNIRILGLEISNQRRLAKALNTKYQAKYYIDDRLLRVGFIVINNTREDFININFIDESLSIVDYWGTLSFKDLLLFDSISKPQDYIDNINELRNYDANFNNPLIATTEVGTRGYKLCEFPNSLNVIGDKFQINANDTRVDDTFNPYQSRPIFNAKAILDLAVESFGFTPIYDPSVNWEKVEKTYIVSGDLDGDDLEDGGFLTYTSRYWNNIGQYGNEVNWQEVNPTWSIGAEHEQIYEYLDEDQVTPSIGATRPIDVLNWVDPPKFHSGDYVNDYTIISPVIVDSTVGRIYWTDTFLDRNGNPDSFVGKLNFFMAYAIWNDVNPANPPVFLELVVYEDTEVDPGQGVAAGFFIEKNELQTPPAGAGTFVGIIAGYNATERPRNARDANGNLIPLQIVSDIVVSDYFVFGTPFFSYKETVLPSNVITFDEHGQYIADQIDLTFGAPINKIKDLVSSINQKESILMNIDATNKEVKFFSYEQYATKRIAGEFEDWSDFLIDTNETEYSTDYGNGYGKINEISLKSPYRSNVYKYDITNAIDDVKYKEVATNQPKLFKDVTNAIKINYTNAPYTEFSTSGLSMVEVVGELVNLTQVRHDTSTQGVIPSVALVANVNYATVSQSILEWYNLINTSIKVTDNFLLPIQTVSNFKLDTPVYVSQLGGYYIVEEISEYEDGFSPVQVKLIKINLSDEILETLRNILLTATLTDSDHITEASIDPSYIFQGLLPTSADIYYQFTDAGGTDIGPPTIQAITVAASGTAPTFNVTKTNESQFIKLWIEDDTGLLSNIVSFEITRYINPGQSITLSIDSRVSETINEDTNALSYTASYAATGLIFNTLYSVGSGTDLYTENGPWTVVGTPDSATPDAPHNFNETTTKGTMRDSWRKYQVRDDANGILSNEEVAYIEGRNSTIWRLTGNLTYEPSNEFISITQVPAVGNGYILKLDISFTNGFNSGSYRATVQDLNKPWIVHTFEIPKVFHPPAGADVILDGIYDFDLSTTSFATAGNYSVKINYDTSYSSWHDFVIV